MIKTYWQQLSLREQRLLMLTSAVVLVSLLYFGLWQPLQDGIELKRKRIHAQHNEIQLMQTQATQVRPLAGGAQARDKRAGDSSSMLAIIERTANQKKLKSALQKIQPESQDSVRLWLESIVFDRLIEWLALLDRQHGISVADISLERTEQEGRVDGRVLLQAPL